MEAEYNHYSKRIGTALALQKKLLKDKEKLTSFKEPLLCLTRHNGTMELYHNVQESEWIVPGTGDGVEKKILLGRQWQSDFPYAGKTFKIYWCHEDWTFPHIWGKPQRYNGPNKEAPNNGWILEQANMASEVFRDRERKVLMAWEKFQTKAGQKDWLGIAKAVGIVAAVILGLFFAYNAGWFNLFTGGEAAAAIPPPTEPTGVTIG